MANVLDVAKFLLYLGQRDNQVNDLSNLKLQKLLYYTQGLGFTNHGEPLIDHEEMEAWQFGPVFRSVYKEFNSYGSRPIQFEIGENQHLLTNNFNLTPQEMTTIFEAWETYSEYNPWELVERTHQEQPWVNAWENNELIITNQAIQQFFQNGEPVTDGFVEQ